MSGREILQTCMGILGSAGFAVLFHVSGRKIPAVMAGAGISWAVYLAALHLYGDKVIALLISTITVGVLAELLARFLRTPVTILLVPMLVPLIPGSDLYYTTSFLIKNESLLFSANLNLLIREAGAIAFGIILVTCLIQTIQRARELVK